MKKNFVVALLTVLLAVTSCSFTTKKFDPDSDKDKVLIELITYVLEQGHFDLRAMDDDFSEDVFNEFIQNLDPLKRHFLQADYEEFAEYKHQLDEQIKNKDLSFFELVYNRHLTRVKESKVFYQEILDQAFDFNTDEDINTDYENLPYAKNQAELKERWRKQLKFNTLGIFYDNYETQLEYTENKDKNEDVDEDFEVKSLEALEEEARETTKESMQMYFENSDDLERKDWFSMYINSVVSQFDPHTSYFAPRDKERFDVSMSGKLEGIGARLQKERDHVKIMELISGGPAWRGDELEVGDVIQKVRQEDEEEAVNIGGMRLDYAVDLIKGPKGTKVYLTVKKVDGTIEEIEITRDVVEIDETYAKTSLVEKDEVSYGVINLPKFYFDMQDYNQRNAASDVKKEIIRLKERKAEGLVIDLRSNGGGSLSTVVDIAGLFIEKGPIVQVKDKERNREVLKDKDPSILWEGPLVILVNELSASASEILAAAMQDYERAVIIGSKQTYGKGTVQNVSDLNRWMRQSSFGDMGALKLTTQKFYRINGGSTQLKGVESDVVVADRYSYVDIGERDYDNPLPWDKIEPAKYNKWNGYKDLDKVLESSKKRMKENQQLALIDQNAKWIKEQRDINTYTLNFDKYKLENFELEEKNSKFKKINDYTTDLEYVSLPYEEKLIENDSVLGQKRERWHKNLKKDVYVEEAIYVLEDLRKQTKAYKLANAK
ncbi:carboxy terminal-processing peptidase [Psychroflexus planctonicus]|uniref:Tail-specific protease n=1 Tax=Psychroflexus planctonicus TaxID=1526575 RepID=A0ABQ1SJ68_9FLAO|nr:carboxy terminal-processing peptidase [Psychroflexus planctonicus]GGE42249.1 tail-specific protease [Psychroflexus planctonicus]